MTIFAILNELHAKGIKLWQEDGQLKLKAPKGALTDDIREQLISNKSDIIAFLQDASSINKIPPIQPINRAGSGSEGGHPLPLSFAQERLWFIDQLEPNTANYNIPGAVIIRGDFGVDLLEEALNLIIVRHENLRTIFPSQNGQAQQLILDSFDFKFERIDLSHEKTPEIRHQKAQIICRSEAQEPFDLTKGPLIRGRLIKLTERIDPQTPQEYVLMLNMHHIISDDWSMGVMIKELGLIMDALRQGKMPNLLPLPIQYADYSVWQRKWLSDDDLEQGGILKQQLDYWKKKLTGVPQSLNLVTDYPRKSIQGVGGATEKFTLDTQLTNQLKTLAEQQDCTLYMALLAVFKVLLYRYTGQEDICIGTPIANRQHGETESLIGMFVNTLALRNLVEGDESFVSLLSRVRTTCLDAYEHQDAPFEKIVDLVQPQRNMAINPLFQVMFILQNASEEARDSHIHPYGIESNSTSKFDLTLEFIETTAGLAGTIEYSTSLFNSLTIKRIVKYFTGLSKAIVTAPTSKIGALDYISEHDKQNLLIGFNNTQTDYLKEKCIHQLFVEQAAINPDNTAVVYAGQDTEHPKELTYKELYNKSYDLALYLQSLGIGPDSLVGLCMERSLDMIVGIMGILQAGGAYVPLDPDYPEERLEYMLKSSQPAVVLTLEKLNKKLSTLIPENTKLITLDQSRSATEVNQQQDSALQSGHPCWPEIATFVADLKRKKATLREQVKPENVSYVIYTSGSTGKPKGVLLKHKTLTNLVSWQLKERAFREAGNIVNFTGTNFDVFMQEISSCLSSGCSFIIPDVDTVRDTALLGKFIVKNNINKIFLPYVALTYLLEELTVNYDEIPLKYIITAGEQLAINEKVKNFFEKYSDVHLYNHYGPSESHVVTSYTLPKDVKTWKVFPSIGTPIANTQIYILDPNNNPVPIGVPGELHIAGDGLGRGYLNRPELTEERFIPNPFNPGARMYKSGDLARWLDDGNIEYLGRIDTQVKIRGFRIELGEIEAQLNQYPDISNNVVVVQGQGVNKKLIAFYVSAEETTKQSSEDLKTYLLQSLPEYMLPAAFVSLETIPLTPNGKVNRRALEHMDVSLESSQAYLAPRNATEQQLVAIWAEVLNLESEKIGVNDNFFELGGHSLLATQLISRIRSQFAIDVPLKAVFEHANISSFTEIVVKAETSKVPSILPVSRTDADGRRIESYPLSYAQERLWFIDQLEPNSAGYNIPAAVTISGELEVDHLEQAFNLIIARHENLRTLFPSREGQAQQVVLNGLDFKLERIDLSHYKSNKTRHKKAKQLCQTEAATPFDLHRGPLVRGVLIKLTEQENILILTMHHIVSDGWSMGVMIREFGLIMDCLQQGKSPDLPPLPIQYLDYSIWQRQWLEEGGVLEQQLVYWKEKLAGVPESLNLATDYPRPSVQSFAGARQTIRLDSGLTSQLKRLAEQQGCTLFMTLLAAFKVLLYRYTGEEDICLGSPIANRQYGETESLIGMFVNTLALRNQVEGGAPFISFLAQVKTTCLEAYEHQDMPFEKIVDLVQPGRNKAINPLFQIMFSLHSASKESIDQHIQSYPLDNDLSKFDLTAGFVETAEGLEGEIEYSTALFNPKTIERMAQHFFSLCQAIVSTPSAKISDLEFIDEVEKQQLLIDYNDTQADYPHDKCIHQLFIEQVAINPDKIAVVYEDEALSYQQLYDKSHALALYLQSLGVQPDNLVGLCVERSLEMLVGILGILQAGGAYVPLDPDYPDDRLAYMLQDSQTTVVLSQEKLRDKLSALVTQNTQLIALDQQWSEVSDCAADLKVKQVKLQQEVKAHHLAYVIYTSGSTGKPKGVMVEHKSVMNYLNYCVNHYFPQKNNDYASFIHFPLSFDASVTSLFSPLILGKTIVINSKNNIDFFKHGDFLDKGYDFIKLTPSHLLLLKNNLSKIPKKFFKKKNLLILGGEALTSDHLDFLNMPEVEIEIINEYGPTEATVGCITARFSAKQLKGATLEAKNNITIGAPIANTQVYILDQYNNPQSIGVPGELHIAGDGLARGYLNRPELTEEKFIPNPFNPGTRMYKSGDLCRWLVDGNIEYLGRIDTQVKIRGFRIEPGEIETQLNQYTEIKDSVIITQGQESNKKLIAYYVARGTQKEQIVNLANEDLKAHLQQTLPDYMLPAAFVSLEAIPLTPNGKVDRRALERMDVNLESSQVYLSPRNATEKQLVAIWAKVLNLKPEKIGVNDNFFELGGHSLLATQLISRVRSQFDIDLPLKALFEHASIAGFAPLVVKAETNKIPPILPVSRTDHGGELIESFPLSYAQERLWFIDQLEPDSAGYNIPAAVTISGDADGRPLGIDHLELAFNLMIARHENLRTIFPSQEGQARQVILDNLDFALDRIDLSHYKSNETRHKKARQLCQTEAATPFDLANGPLIRGKLIEITAQEHILMLTMHHIISDGWSMGVMIKEFGVIMDCLRQGRNPDKSPSLPALPIQYLDYSIWQRKLLEEGGVLEQQLAYWQEKLTGVPESLNLATDYPRPSIQNFSGARQAFRFDAQLNDQLRSLAEQQGCTLYMTLLAAFKVLLYRYTGEKDICLGSPIANRHYEETESLVGMFVNTLALRSQLDGDASFISLLDQVKTTCLEAYEHQDTPFEKIVDLVQPERNMSISALFQIMFVLQNAPEESTEQTIQSYSLGSDTSKFDLTIGFTETRDGLEGEIEYSTALFKPQTIERMAQHFVALCQAIISTPTAKLSDLKLIGEAEKQQFLTDFNNTQADYPHGKCIHQLFIEQVAIHPDKIAVVYEDESLSYQQLYDKSHTLALYLQSLGVKPDSLVGLCVERSLEMMVGILGILQAGGAYVPLDHEYPDARLSYMLEDSQVAIVLTQEKFKERLSSLTIKGTNLITLDQQGAEMRECVNALKSKHDPLLHDVTPNNLVYVIYTSGSTGKPKGVMVEHQGVVNTVNWFTEKFNVNENSRLIQLTDFTFDPSVEDIFGSLTTGATLYIPATDLLLDESNLVHYIKEKEISGLNFVPGILKGLLCDYDKLESIEFVISGGEKLDESVKNAILEKGYHLYNNYGPTEATIDVLSTKCTGHSVVIGSPIANTQVYILASNNNPVPIGVPGELHIAGDGLARGYLNRPELTEEKFISNPFNPGTRMYKSGDLARWLGDGNIEFLGRIDTQVKIRGFRIELGEIEARLNQYPEIRDNVVVAQGQEDNKQLIAYYVANGTKGEQIIQLENEALRAFLSQTLPVYMVPATFVSLKTIPLTPNGKVDRSALERMDVSLKSSQVYLAPRNATEKQLVAVWAELLDLEPDGIGVNDNFFELGGHSLLAVRLMAKINAQFKRSLPLAVLFSASSTAALAKLIASKEDSSFDVLVPIQTKGDKPAIFAVPGAGGNVLSFQPLSHALGSRQPFYGLQAVGLDGETLPLDSVEKTAKANITALRSIQATGPYRIIGHSYGGVVAYEMAKILVAQDEKIASLILLDSFAPSVIQHQDTTDETATLLEVCISLANLYGITLNLDRKSLQKVPKDKRSETISSIFNRHEIDVSTEQFTTFYNVFKANRLCYLAYKPSIFSHKINVSLFRAIERHHGRDTINDYGWNELLLNPIQIVDVKASHFSMLDKNHIQQIVKKISS